MPGKLIFNQYAHEEIFQQNGPSLGIYFAVLKIMPHFSCELNDLLLHKQLKPSGIDGLGDIPEHWKVKRLKGIVKGELNYGANESAIYEDRDLPRYTRITDFANDGKSKMNRRGSFDVISLDYHKK